MSKKTVANVLLPGVSKVANLTGSGKTVANVLMPGVTKIAEGAEKVFSIEPEKKAPATPPEPIIKEEIKGVTPSSAATPPSVTANDPFKNVGRKRYKTKNLMSGGSVYSTSYMLGGQSKIGVK